MKNAFDLTVNALRKQGLNSDEILKELSGLFQKFSEFANVAKIKTSDEKKIRMLLNKVGMPVEIKGYNYWVKAILIYKSTNGIVQMQLIYQQVAENYGITPASVERAMRFAIECTCEKCDKEMFYTIFGKNISAKTGLPKNNQSIAVISELI